MFPSSFPYLRHLLVVKLAAKDLKTGIRSDIGAPWSSSTSLSPRWRWGWTMSTGHRGGQRGGEGGGQGGRQGGGQGGGEGDREMGKEETWKLGSDICAL